MTPNSSSINTVYSVRQIRVRPVLQLKGNCVDAMLKGGRETWFISKKLHKTNNTSTLNTRFIPSNAFIFRKKNKKLKSCLISNCQAFTSSLAAHCPAGVCGCSPPSSSSFLTKGPAVWLDYFYFSIPRDTNTWLMVGREGQRKRKLLLKTLVLT